MLKALVVDDDRLVRATVSAMLSTLMCDVVEASNGRFALKMLIEDGFDLVITDLFMPEGDGFELAIKIRKFNSTIPIVLMTGGGRLFPQGSSALNDLTCSAEFIGASYVLQKPLRKKDFTQVLVQISESSEAHLSCLREVR